MKPKPLKKHMQIALCQACGKVLLAPLDKKRRHGMVLDSSLRRPVLRKASAVAERDPLLTVVWAWCDPCYEFYSANPSLLEES